MPQDYVSLIKQYCEDYDEWPLKSSTKVVNGKDGSQLNQWLYKSGYNTGKFEYANEVDENGNSLLDTLKRLEARYKTCVIMVKAIKEYCETHNEWPKRYIEKQIADGRTGNQLAKWLQYSEYNTGNFKYANEIDENGNNLLDNLKKLEARYKPSVIMVKEIKEYCNVYHEWPTQHNVKQIASGKTSEQLRQWLDRNGYNIGSFKYANEVDEDGRPLIEILDELYEIYSKKRTAQDYVKAIKEYCNVYQEWPAKHRKNKVINGKTGSQLATWLKRSGYNSGDFKYVNEKDENGRPLIEILDELYEICSQKIWTAQDYVKTIEEYCFRYGWPRDKDKTNSMNGKTGEQLYNWLSTTSKYTSGNFRYANEVDESGHNLWDILRHTEAKYKYSVLMVKAIEEYCKIYNEWPKYQSIKEANGKTGDQLITWLKRSGYNNGDFKYANEVDENGRNLIEVLNALKERYQERPCAPQEYVKAIEEYCKTYGEWPKQHCQNKIANGKASNQLANWLYNSGYNDANFKYVNEVDETGRPLIDILNELMLKYSKSSKSSKRLEQLKEIKQNLEIVSDSINKTSSKSKIY